MSDPFFDWLGAQAREDLAMYDREYRCVICGQLVVVSAIDDVPNCDQEHGAMVGLGFQAGSPTRPPGPGASAP